MITRRNALWLIPLLILLSFPLWRIPVASFLAPPTQPDDSTAAERPQEEHDFSMAGLTILQSEGSRETAVIHAERARTSNTPDEYILEAINADITNNNGDVVNVVAMTGDYNIGRKRLKLMVNVVITNTAENMTMHTELLYYNGVKRTVFSPAQTLLQGDGIRIEGSSFSHDMKAGKYVMGGRVYCTLEGYDAELQ
ncbi:MAG: LPS export ABC transporter periplasmic protein LptC [Desulfopila sp.]|jgi:LPS export ABC transporter protein LptC|nr:LPS export ABC transporter periplasmic protein LptC [Desulfopila sp.]